MKRSFKLSTKKRLELGDERRKRGLHTSVEPIRPREDRGSYPLSLAQQRLWFLDQLQDGDSAYNMPAAVRLGGDLDVAALRLSLREIVRRHESLRATFPASAGEPLQVVSPQASVPVPLVDLAGLPAGHRETEALSLAHQDARRCFDLATGPLLRIKLLRTGSEEYFLVFVLHHIVWDGWSTMVFIRELASLYGAFTVGRPSPLAELPIQFADFAAWQRRRMRGERLETQLDYWRRQLAGAPRQLELATDRPRTASPLRPFGQDGVSVCTASMRRLSALAQRHGATLYIALNAVFKVLLRYYTGQDDVVVGTPVAGRSRPEAEGLIGFFVNTLALRSDLSGDPSFEDVLHRVKRVSGDALSYQDVPFDRVVEELQPERVLGQTPLVQVVFLAEGDWRPEIPGLETELVELVSGAAKFDLVLRVTSQGDRWAAQAQYDAGLFDRTTILRLLGGYRQLLESAAGHPARRLSELASESRAQRHQVLAEWNVAAFRRNLATGAECFSDLFEAQAARTPDAVAAVFGETVLTYRELDARCRVLAEELQSRGVGPEVRVGLCLRRSLEWLTGTLAVMKAGGAFVPLDPAYPQERLVHMAMDARLTWVLTDRSTPRRLTEMGLGELRMDPGQLSGSALAGRPSRLHSANLAYVIYTSGSTGRPKGVALAHRGLVQLAGAQRGLFGLGPGRRALQFSSLSFDASVWELSMTLSSGATLVLGEAEDLMPGPGLLSLMVRQRVDTVTLPPSALAALVAGGLDSLRDLVVAGEACTADLVDLWGSRRRFVNAYGPSEGTVCATAGRCRPGGGVPAIGRPIEGFRTRVLDQRSRILPIGVAGELAIGGLGLARGYLGQPGLTAQKFVPDPDNEEAGCRLYRTGDLVRHLADGRLVFLGRVDHQVKLRGFRIELGEIEAVLAVQPEVRQAAVVVCKDPVRLVAYVVPSPEETAGGDTRQRLLSRLTERLPAFMVPSELVVLESMPTTPSGKVDRGALPEPARTASRAPRTPVEELLVAAFSEVLGVESVGVEDDFFQLGGHSLLATQLVSRIRQTFRVDLPVRSIFEAPTVLGLAARVLRASESTRPALRRETRRQDPPLSFAQQRFWFLHQVNPKSALFNVPLVVSLQGRLDVPALAASLRTIVTRHEVLRTTIGTRRGGPPVQLISAKPPPGLSTVDLDGLSDSRRRARALASEEARRPFDLTRGPLLRTLLIALGPEEHWLAVIMHHVVTDGWSMGVFTKELETLYNSLTDGRPSPLPPLGLQYGDFSSWQRQWLSRATLEAEVRYWKEQLGSSPPVLSLPTDRPRPSIRTVRGAGLPVTLPADLGDGVRALCRKAGATPFMVILAAIDVTLHRLTGQRDVLVGTPVAGRVDTQLEELIGVFVNMLVLRAEIVPEARFSDLLEQVRESSLEAYAHQDLPFEILVEEMAPARDLAHTPLFQVMFALQNMRLGFSGKGLAGLRHGVVPIDSATSRYDLSFAFGETDGTLAGAVEYNRDLFDGSTIGRLARHLVEVLRTAVAAPERRLEDLEVHSRAARHQALAEWNDTAGLGFAGGEADALRWVESRVDRVPEAVALVFEEDWWSYRQLDRRANQLARRLRREGVGPEVLVALGLERSPAMVLAVLAVMKAGGAYVPLDPSHPPERLKLILEDAGRPLVVTERPLLESLSLSLPRVLCLDEVEREVSAESCERPAVSGSPESLAYTIFTSGSTGRPKGVQINRRSLANFLASMRDRPGFDARDVWVAVTTLAFDISGLELLLPLVVGGRVVVARREDVTDAARLSAVLEASRATVLQATPATWRQCLSAGFRCVPGFRTLSGGEALPGDLAAGLREAGATVWNLYGPTETTIWSSVERVGPVPAATVSLGRPIANTTLFVVGGGLHPMPVGAAGELLIGGAGLARGYHGGPARTAARFVPDPWASDGGSRLYRTGDLVRRLADGRLEYLGRRDHQVKVRGVRIELAEIEQALVAHPGLREAVVMARDSRAGDRRLVAYVSSSNGPVPTISELRRFLSQRLPESMLPSALVELDRLPLNDNGKVNRRALPEPSGDRPAQEVAYEAPSSELESRLAEIWQQVLGVARVGIHDNFFDLGGHSLLLIEVQSRIAEGWGIDIPMLELFEHPNLHSLARRLQEIGTGGEVAVDTGEARGEVLERGKARMRERLAQRRRVRTESAA